MYCSYWKLNKFPFENVPSSRFFYHSPQHEEALTRLLYAAHHNKGAAMLTGEVGSGKTTVSRAFMEQLSENAYETLSIVNPTFDSTELLKTILLRMGLESDTNAMSALLEGIHRRLVQNAQRSVRTVLVIDEAHVIERQSTFEQLRMLLNLQHNDQFLITLILMGQVPLRKKVAELKPLEERIAIKYQMTPFDFEDTFRYVLFRLKTAGSIRGIFTMKAMHVVYHYSHGIPLRINNLCDRSLLIGLMRRAKVIDSGIVTDAIEDLK